MHKLPHFRLEEYLAPREFSDALMFSGSDVESRCIQDILNMAEPDQRASFFDLSLRYTTPEGALSLRTQIATQLYQAIKAQQILCFAGAEEAIYTAARALLDETSHAITYIPCYQSLASVAATICDTTCLPIQKKENGWYLDLNELKDSIKPNTKVIFLNFPHNPTGYVPPLETLQSIIELAREYNIWVFCDEVNRGLYRDKIYYLPNVCDLYEKGISLGVMSKSFGFPGLRIGWVACQDTTLLRQLGEIKHYLSISNSAPSEWLAEVILINHRQILQENNKLVSNNLNLLREYFQQNTHLFNWYEPQGGCIVYPQYLGNERIMTTADALLAEKNIIILPDWVYDQKNNHFRIGYGRRNMEICLELFSDFFRVRR